MNFYSSLSVFLFVLGVCCMGCRSSKDDGNTKTLSKESSVEVIIKTKHLDDRRDVLCVTHRVYLKNNLIKEHSVYDTIPSLGTQMVEDDDGKNTNMKKDYDVFVTIK